MMSIYEQTKQKVSKRNLQDINKLIKKVKNKLTVSTYKLMERRKSSKQFNLETNCA